MEHSIKLMLFPRSWRLKCKFMAVNNQHARTWGHQEFSLEVEIQSSLWHPRCLHSRIVLILRIKCLFCLKKDLIVKIKGYLCKYDFMQGLFYSVIWVGRANIAFVECLFIKFSIIIAWQKILLFSLKLNWICNGKDKSPLNSKSFLCFQNNSLTFCQINFCATSKL